MSSNILLILIDEFKCCLDFAGKIIYYLTFFTGQEDRPTRQALDSKCDWETQLPTPFILVGSATKHGPKSIPNQIP